VEFARSVRRRPEPPLKTAEGPLKYLQMRAWRYRMPPYRFVSEQSLATTFRTLGPLEVRVGDLPVALGGPKQRAVLAILLLHAGEVVSTDALIEGLWGDRPPATARGTVQVYVSQLRRALAAADADDAAIETAGAGYLVRVAPGALDLARFDARIAEGRAALDDDDPARASEAYAGALALWRGPALADFT
jgi:DNA-binding SARP family transcriptional activator